MTEQSYHTMRREASQRLREGDLPGSIELQTRLVEQLMAGGPAALQTRPERADQLEKAAVELVDILRWDGQYEQAIALQDRLIEFLPDSAVALRLGAANLRVEGGQAETGLTQLQEMAAAEPDNFWFQISLALAYLYVEQFSQAEQILRRAAGLAHVRKVDRALAQRYLFGMLDLQGRTDEALAAWREAARLDRALRAGMLPAVCRMLVYRRAFNEAANHIAMETNRVRQAFYRGLLLKAQGQLKEAMELWGKLIIDYNPSDMEDGHDEYAEASVRLGASENALLALDPLVKAGQSSYFRTVILGLAWAERKDADRARWYMALALRMGDMERPRRTSLAPQGRILDEQARLLYAECPISMESRLRLNGYFIPIREDVQKQDPTA